MFGFDFYEVLSSLKMLKLYSFIIFCQIQCSLACVNSQTIQIPIPFLNYFDFFLEWLQYANQ